MYPFYENYIAFGKNSPCQTSKQSLKTKQFLFYFFKPESKYI